MTNAEPILSGCCSIDVDLTQLDRIDGAGAVLLARLLDRLEGGRAARVSPLKAITPKRRA